MERSHDYLIGRDIVLEELEPLSDLLNCLPSKAQFGPKNLVGHFWEKTKEHGVKSLFSSLKERAHENFKSLKIEYTCLDVSFDAVVLGTNLGVIFLYDRTCKKLSRLPSEVTHEPAQCLKLLSAHSFVAVGFSSGLITIFTFVLASQGFGKLQTLHVSGAHNCKVTCLEWSPDGELLYSGDLGNKVYVTVINFHKGLTQTALMLEETSPIVQLAYSWEALLISSEKRTVLWDFRSENLTQVGQKERKSPGKYGACFYPPARPSPDEDTNNSPSVYTSRPGLRLWTADTGGKVSATLMYKGLTNENPPGITILSPPPPCLTKHPPDFQAQFGRLLIYHGQFLVTWDISRLWVLDTSPCALVGFHGNLGDIVDVSTAGHEIYILQRGGERLIMKLSLIPKLPNPLVDLATLTEHSYKEEDHSDGDKKQEEPTVSQTESTPVAEISQITEAVTSEDGQSVVTSVTEDPVKPAPNPFHRYQEIRHQDFGEIVFKKTKRSKKKNQQDTPPRLAVESDTEAEDRTTSVDSQDGFKSCRFPSRSGEEPKPANSIDPANGSLELSSDISSYFDSTERNDDSSSEKIQIGEGEDEHDTTRPHLMVVHVTESGEQEKHAVDLDCVTTTDEVTEPSVAPAVKSQERSISPNSHTSVSDDTLTPEETLCADSLVSSMSSVMECETEDDTDELLSPDESYQADYLPNIYSNTPVNISDATFSDVSVEKSPRSRSRVTKSTMSAAGSSLSMKGSSDVQTDSEGTPPVSLDSEGAEELSDTASWTWSLTRRTLSDVEVFHHSDASALEGSFSSQSSESSLSRSPVSTNLNLRLLADSWADYSPPGHGYVQFVAVSDTHIWCVTTHEFIFYCPTHFSVVTWTQLRGSAKMIAVNIAGDVIWCIDRKNYAFTRAGVSSNHLTGKKWVPVEKDMRFVTIEDTAVWGIKLNGDVFVRTEVTRDQPAGKGWRTIQLDTPFVQVSCMNGIVWFVDKSHRIHVFRGVNPSKPAEKENWEQLQDVSAKWICLGIEGVAWIVDVKGALWFSNVTHENPMGGTWYQVSLGQYLMQDRSLLESLWSWVVRGDEVKLLTASPKAGVWLLGRTGSLQASHGHLLGTRWNPLTPHGMAQSVFWSYLSAGALKGDKGHVWALQPNGELICFKPGGRPIFVEPPKRKVLKLVAASGPNLWAITHNFKVVQRMGISDACPEGFDWMDLNLEQFGVGKVYHLSCGALSTWVVDDAGNVWFRIGKEDSQDPAVTQAWIPVDGSPLHGCRFAKVAVSPADRVVWAVDDRNNVYARREVTPSFPIGTSWEVVPGTGVRDLAMSEHMIWATCPNGDIVCRYGVSESNCLGHYWKKLPGNFELISVSPDDELWAIDQNGRLFLRKTQHFYGTQSPFRPRTYSALFSGEDDWEFI